MSPDCALSARVVASACGEGHWLSSPDPSLGWSLTPAEPHDGSDGGEEEDQDGDGRRVRRKVGENPVYGRAECD